MECHRTLRCRTERIAMALALPMSAAIAAGDSAAQSPANNSAIVRQSPALSPAEIREQLRTLRLESADTAKRSISKAPFLIGGTLIGAGVTAGAVYYSYKQCSDCTFVPMIIAIPILSGAGLGTLAGWGVHAGVQAISNHGRSSQSVMKRSSR